MDRLLEGILARKRLILLGLIPLLSLILHVQILNRDLMGVHVWRQAETMNNVVNFATEDGNILNPRVNDLEHWGEGGLKRMEFPLMQWIFSLFYRVFGEEILVIRLLCFLIGLFAVWGMAKLAEVLFAARGSGLWAAWTFAWSPVFFYYMVNPLPDLLALTAGIWALAYFFDWQRNRKRIALWATAGFLALATLVKLPFILFYGLPFFWILRWMWRTRLRDVKALLQLAAPFLLSMLPWLAWYLWVIPGWTGNGVVAGILDATREDLPLILEIFTAHLVSLLPELFLSYGSTLFFLGGLFFLFKDRIWRKDSFGPILAWGGLVILYFLFEINMIGTEHDYYMFPFLPGLFLIVTFGVLKLLQVASQPVRAFLMLVLLILPLFAWVRVQTRWDANKPSLNKDLITYHEELRAASPADAVCVIGNDGTGHVMYYYLKRKGFYFKDNDLSADRLQSYRERGAEYLYSDSREVEALPDIRAQLSGPIQEYGSVYVWKLK